MDAAPVLSGVRIPTFAMKITVEQASALLLGARDILLLTHRRPDGDTVGSAAALCHALRALGKTAYVLSNPDITPRYTELLRLLLPPEDFTPAFILAVDTADPSLLTGNARQFDGAIRLSIDHHRTCAEYTEYTCVDSSAAACGEIVYRVIRELGVPLTPSMADALYTAISTDTGCFRFANTTASAFRVAADLIEAGAHSEDINYALFVAKPRTRIALEHAVQGRLYFFCEGRVAGAAISRAMVEETGATEDDLDGISALPRQIEGVEAGITAVERADGCKISLRTGKLVDASEICRQFGGGGHRRAAGCTLQNTLVESIALIAAAVERVLNGQKDGEGFGT